jgi:hypothetical protein
MSCLPCFKETCRFIKQKMAHLHPHGNSLKQSIIHMWAGPFLQDRLVPGGRGALP